MTDEKLKSVVVFPRKEKRDKITKYYIYRTLSLNISFLDQSQLEIVVPGNDWIGVYKVNYFVIKKSVFGFLHE